METPRFFDVDLSVLSKEVLASLQKRAELAYEAMSTEQQNTLLKSSTLKLFSLREKEDYKERKSMVISALRRGIHAMDMEMSELAGQPVEVEVETMDLDALAKTVPLALRALWDKHSAVITYRHDSSASNAGQFR